MGLATLLSLVLLQGPFLTEGYCYPLSVLPGDSVTVYLSFDQKENNYPVKLFDLGGKEVARYRANVFPQETAVEKPWENGFGYKATLKIVTPRLKSGVYVWENKVPLIIRSPNPKIVVVYTSNTENAYCNAGGKGLYDFNSSDKVSAQKVSFLRPINLPKHSEAFLRWFQHQNFKDVGYITDADLDNYSSWRKAELLLIVGHSEYWTLEARRNFDRFVEEGKNAIVLSGNTMWWQVRYSKKKDQLICYKLKEDPVKSKRLKTTNWTDPELEYPIINSIGADFPRAGYGRKVDKGWDGYKIVTASPLLEGTNLKKGDILKLASDENDGAPLAGFDNKGFPMLDYAALGFNKIEIVGFDHVFRINDSVATWIVFRRTKSSGIIINAASTDWCSSEGMGDENVKKITLNMINKLLKKGNVFSSEVSIQNPRLVGNR
jgi:hypothetical protein